MLGAFDSDNNHDRPDLNKCPDCGCFFAQDHCPLCGKLCPEEMRAGNRKAVKPEKRKKADAFYQKVLSIRLLCCIIELPQTTNKKAR